MAATKPVAAAAAAVRLPPRMGGKQIYLPNFTLTLLRPPPSTPPTLATFLTPLNLNKLDLRDYLWHMYSVRATRVRSFIQQQKIQQDRPGARRPAPRRWHRPRAVKKMMVELDRPFVWPRVPGSLEAWDGDTFEAARRENERVREGMRPEAKMRPSGERSVIAEEARGLLLGGKELWERGRGVWEDVGEAVEVEEDVELPKD